VIYAHARLSTYSFKQDCEGIELLKHLRTTTVLGDLQQCHVIIVSWESAEQLIKRKPGNIILFTSGVSFLRLPEAIEILSNGDELRKRAAEKADLKDDPRLWAAVRADYKPPDSAHQMSNWWGAWRLIQTIEEHDATMPPLVRANMSILANKQALFLAHASDKPGKVDQKKIKRLQSLVRESAPTICYVDDEADKGWAHAFKTLLYGTEDSSGFRVVNPIDVDPITSPVKDKLPQLAELILGFAPNLLILDLRLEGEDEALKAPKEASGALLLEEIRKKDKGVPILLMTASNKARMLQDIVKLGADAYWMKEGIGEHAFLYTNEKPANELIRLLNALLGLDWQFLLRFQKAQDALRFALIRSQCWWSSGKRWKKAVQWPATMRAGARGVNPKLAPQETSLTPEGLKILLDILEETARLYREYLGQGLLAYEGGPRSLSIKDLWLRGIAIHAARVIEGVHRYDEIENGAGEDYVRMIPKLAKERGDTIGQEIIYHRNGAAHYRPEGQFDEERTRDLLGMLCAWLRLDPLYDFGVNDIWEDLEDWDPEYRLIDSLARYRYFKRSPIDKLSLLMFKEAPWKDEYACAQLLASESLGAFRTTEGNRIGEEVLLNIVNLEDGQRAALALQCLQPFAQKPEVQAALQKRWIDGNAPSPLKCHLVWRIGDDPGLTEAFRTGIRSWIFENFDAWTQSAQKFFCATPENILVAIRKKLDEGSVYPEHKKWIVICCAPISSEKEAARQLLLALSSADVFVDATKVEVLERFFPEPDQTPG
jgi:CheY-like chemotaxis protein